LDDLKDATEIEFKNRINSYEKLFDQKTALQQSIEDQNTKFRKIKQSQLDQAINCQNIWTACEHGDINFLKNEFSKLWWWQKKDFLNQQNQDGCTVLSLAVTYQHINCVKWLLVNGADATLPDKLGYQPIHWASKKGLEEVIMLLVNQHQCDVNAKGEFGRTPLHMAAHNGHPNICKFLIKKGANINSKTNELDGCLTPLHEAVMLQKTLVVVELLKSKSLNVNLVNGQNHSPLYCALLLGDTEIAAHLMVHSSWSLPTDKNDPNHISKLKQLKPCANEDGVKKFLSPF
jgi:ankyrin repeat protein